MAVRAIQAEVAARFDPNSPQSPRLAELLELLAEMQRLLAVARDDFPSTLVEPLPTLLERLVAGLAAHMPATAVEVPLAALGLAAEAVRLLLCPDSVAGAWFVTVAAPDGALLDLALLNRLNAQLIQCGAASGALVRARNYEPAYFDAGVAIRPRPGADAETLERAVRAALLARWEFSFGRLGRPIAASDVLAAILAVPGVGGGKVTHLNRHGRRRALRNRLEARSSGSGPAKLLIPRDLDVALLEAF
jgi:hypothetical protein